MSIYPEVYRITCSAKAEKYCWSIYENQKILNRDAIVLIYAFGDVTSAQIEIFERVTSMNKEAMHNNKGGRFEDMIPQVP